VVIKVWSAVCCKVLDGAPAHFSISPLRHLNAHYPVCWIGRGGPVAWSPCSPDLNSLDFYLWGHIKSVVYLTPVDDVPTLHVCIMATCQTVRIIQGIFYCVRHSLRRQAEAYIQAGGCHFEHFISSFHVNRVFQLAL
jgi:hypothetical protein